MIKKYTLIALQKAINHALSLDETMPAKMKKLDGKVIELIISPLNAFFFITFADQSLILLSNYDGEPDTIIHSSPIGLIRLSILPTSKVRSLFNDQIKISGNIELGQQLKNLFDEIDIDWEGHLAHFTGDVVAHQIGSLMRRGHAFQQQISSSMFRQLSEYIQEEAGLVPPTEELNDFFQDVDELSLRTERLAAHVNQLLVKYEAH